MTWKLISQHDTELRVGDPVVTFRNEKGVLSGLRPPHKPSSSGHVTVRIAGRGEIEFYPSVVGARFVSADGGGGGGDYIG